MPATYLRRDNNTRHPMLSSPHISCPKFYLQIYFSRSQHSMLTKPSLSVPRASDSAHRLPIYAAFVHITTAQGNIRTCQQLKLLTLNSRAVQTQKSDISSDVWPPTFLRSHSKRAVCLTAGRPDHPGPLPKHPATWTDPITHIRMLDG